MFILPKKEKFHVGDVVVKDNTGFRTIIPFNRNFFNYPINMDYVQSFRKDEIVFSQVDMIIYQILFIFNNSDSDNSSGVFHFETKEERDLEYENLLNMYVNKMDY